VRCCFLLEEVGVKARNGGVILGIVDTGVAEGPGGSSSLGLTLNVDVKLNIPAGGTGDIDAAMACAILVELFEFAAFAGDSILGDFTRPNVFSSCRNGCDGRVPDRGAKFFPNVERTSALLRVVSGAFIRPGKTGRTGCGIVKPGGGT
jgi:hypothetical protein